MKRILALCLLSLLLALPTLIHAQPIPWQAVVYNPPSVQAPSGELVVITTAGISRRIAMPQALAPTANTSIGNIKVSSDLHYAAVTLYTSQGDTSTPTLAVADLTTGACCTYVLVPTAQPLLAIEASSFSPDNTQFAVVYVSGDFSAQNPFQGGLAAINPISGAMTAQISMEQALLNLPANQPAPFAYITDWRADGIHFLPSCYACDGVLESQVFVWNPATNQTSIAPDEYYSIFSDRLGVTNELLYTRYNPAFPMGTLGGMFEPANTVEYYPTGVPLPEGQRGANAPVVFYDPTHLDLNHARWVLDGTAFVVQNYSPADATLVYRTGARQTFTMPDSTDILTGTPDGWLTLNYQYDQNTQTSTSTISYARVVNGQIGETPLLQSSGDYPLRLVYAAPLGTTASGGFVLSQTGQGGGQSLPTLPPPPPPIVPTTPPIVFTLPPPPPVATSVICPGFLPSRLVVGRTGRVTPGTPNNLRSQPSGTGQVIGQIPGSGVFSVIGGPVCDPAGIAWWQVNYNGVVGWTAEGQGSVYYVEPL